MTFSRRTALGALGVLTTAGSAIAAESGRRQPLPPCMA